VPLEEEAMCGYLGVEGKHAFPAQVFLNISSGGEHKKVMGATADEIRQALSVEQAQPGAVTKLLAAHEHHFFFGGPAVAKTAVSQAAGGEGSGGDQTSGRDAVGASAIRVVRSAVPPSAEQPLVQTVVGSTFEARVLNNHGADVLIMLVAAGEECEGCAGLAKEATKLSKLLKRQKVSSIMVAEMDIAANELANIPGLPADLFTGEGRSTPLPAVYLFRATQDMSALGLKEWAVTQGPSVEMVMEEAEGLVEFLKEFASLPFTLDGDTHGGVRDEL
jgi:hypothetical protein